MHVPFVSFEKSMDMAQMPSYPVDRGNVVEYVETQLDPLSERPLCDVDSLALSWLAYCAFPDAARGGRGVPLDRLYAAGQLGEVTAVMCDLPAFRHLLAGLVASPRFRGMRVCHYVEENDEATGKQFSAVTLRLPDGSSYVAFRGTDGSIVGWREDFNMALGVELPSQRSAVEYLRRVAGSTRGALYVGGHSKGGNLAVYAAMGCPARVARRIAGVFSHDGPGFPASAMRGAAWLERAHLVRKTLPEQSIVGTLFEDQRDYLVVRSSSSGIMQHDPFSWVVGGRDFVYASGLSAVARHLDASIDDWVSSVGMDGRRVFVDTLFDAFAASGAKTFREMGERWQTTVPAMFEYVGKLPAGQRDAFGRVLLAFARELVGDKSRKA